MEHRTARAGAAAVRIPVEVGVEAPVTVEAIGIFQRIRRYVGKRVVASAIVDARQLHLAVFEVQRLTNTEALALEAVFFNPAVGYAQRQLIFVTNPVAAAETVVTEQRAVAEGALTGVEDRNVFLIFIRHVQVVQPRFQGLPVILAEPLSVTVEIQATVNAEDRHITILGAAEFALKIGGSCSLLFTLAVQVQFVMGSGVLDRRLQVTIGRGKRQADFRCRIETITVRSGQAKHVLVNSATVCAHAGVQIAVFIKYRATL
ncbi:hypothetical protein D3C77_163480 [compost metagenome]